MEMTNHAQVRMNQRGITREMLELVMSFGEAKGDRLIINKKLANSLIRQLEQLKSGLLKVTDKGGVVLVLGEDGIAVTTYNVSSYKRGK